MAFNLTKAQWQGHLAMFAFSGCVSGSFSLGAKAANFISPAALNAVRFLLAAMIIGAIATALGHMKRKNFEAPWRFLILGGLFGFYFVMMFEGLKTAAPVSAAAVFTLMPVMSAGFGYLLLRQITTPRMALAIVIAGVGSLWVIFRADVSLFLAFGVGKGELIYFLGCVAHAIYTPLVAKLNRGENPFIFTFGMMIAGFLVLSIAGAPQILATDWLNLPPIVWIALAYVTIFASAASFVLLQFATLRLPSAKVMAYSYLTPVWVILWELAWGNGLPQPMVFLGVAAIILALLVLLRDEERS